MAKGVDIDKLRSKGLNKLKEEALIQEYKNGIPILINWLQRTKSLEVFGWILQSLTSKHAKPHIAPVLLDLFNEVPDIEDTKWSISAVIYETATPDVGEKIIDLVKDKENGSARQMLVLSLGRIKEKRAISLLISLLDDDQVNGHAIEALKRIGAVETKELIEKFLNDPKTWKRKKAQQALKRFQKIRDKQIEKERKKNIRLVQSQNEK